MTGESAQIATGLVQGQMNDILSAISLKRSIRFSLGLSTKPAQKEKLDLLDWSDLSRDEQKLCPPLLLVGGDDLLSGQGLTQISLLLNSHYPIKIVVFSQLDSGVVDVTLNSSNSLDSKNNLALMAMSQRNAYVAQSSIADSNHLQKCVHDMLASQSASIIRIYTPSPNKHGFSPEKTITQAQLAINTRLSPLFSYNPDLEGVFGSRLSLEGNDDITADWASNSAVDNETKDKASDQRKLTPIDWAINEKRFQSHFINLADAKENSPFPTELLEWIKLSKLDQKKKTPFYIKDSDKIAISKEFALMVAETQQLWQTLQELAGLVTPFTQQVEETVAQRLSEEHQQALTHLRNDYEAKLKELEENYNNQTHTKVRNQLLGLAGYDTSNLH
jgi:pyruvate-ferredoxin/flavodoxin oxidoreductase